MAPAAFYHQDSEAVRFWVPVGDGFVGASIRRAVLQYRFRPKGSEEEPIETYARHAAELDAAVQRRVAQGSIEPVMLRDFDLGPVAGDAEARRPA
jgi:hypothetical protein